MTNPHAWVPLEILSVRFVHIDPPAIFKLQSRFSYQDTVVGVSVVVSTSEPLLW